MYKFCRDLLVFTTLPSNTMRCSNMKHDSPTISDYMIPAQRRDGTGPSRVQHIVGSQGCFLCFYLLLNEHYSSFLCRYTNFYTYFNKHIVINTPWHKFMLVPKLFFFTTHFKKKKSDRRPLKKSIVTKVRNEKLNLFFINKYIFYHSIGTNKKRCPNEMEVTGVLLEVGSIFVRSKQCSNIHNIVENNCNCYRPPFVMKCPQIKLVTSIAPSERTNAPKGAISPTLGNADLKDYFSFLTNYSL
jgi:hypothetical protein